MTSSEKHGDDKLAELFRAAASDAGAPPPAFEHGDVVTASRRITARRRSALVGALAVVALVGIGTAVVLPGTTGHDQTSTAAAPAHAPEAGRSGAAAESAPGSAAGSAPGSGSDSGAEGYAPGGGSAQDAAPAPAPPPAAGGAEPAPAPGAAGEEAAPPPAADVPPPAGDSPAPAQAAPLAAPAPLGPGTSACADRQDPALRKYVEQALPEVVGAPEAAVTMDCRPGGERGVNVEIEDGGAAGLLTVVYLPPGDEPGPQASGAESASAPTASGGTVTLSVRPTKAGDPPPLTGKLAGAAKYLAPRL